MILYFAEVQNHSDIPALEFTDNEEMFEYIQKSMRNKKVVYLCKVYNEIYITKHKELAFGWVKNMVWGSEPKSIHIHEYTTFEDAYNVALSMKEGDELCYNDKTNFGYFYPN